ncbi:Uu.00g074300.m01.CDS01 [Anthostomella pinea]|uniref:Uu.00g074300.m01.CDS01 n=1 Tax=Anthostomella pinea TaxID=933095 RepID=A0AAI8VWC3_9PEZI|nr:Uu.00g074300.m01.CDS01 [Anthostomella pinea]
MPKKPANRAVKRQREAEEGFSNCRYHLDPYNGGEAITFAKTSPLENTPLTSSRPIFSWEEHNFAFQAATRIRSIRFEATFNVQDHHLDTIVNLGRQFGNDLEDFHVGSCELGTASITDCPATRFASACPNLQVSFEGASALSDATLSEFVNDCPNLRYINISGSTTCLGRIQGGSWIQQKRDPSFGQNLQKMTLYYQGPLKFPTIQMFTKFKPSIEIRVGTPSHNDLKIFWSGSEVHEDAQNDGEEPSRPGSDSPSGTENRRGRLNKVEFSDDGQLEE